jgi:RNA polymerase sigma factor (sigma-70 family)
MTESREGASSDLPSAAALQSVEERVARGVVAAHRARLDWLLRVPEWTDLLEQGVAVLGLPGRRQGIRLEAALDALALEHKHQLVRWAAEHFSHHLSRAVAQGICRVVGLERFSEIDLDSTLTLRQWGRLREAMLFRLAREHARYKHAQQWLFVSFDHLVAPLVAQIVFAEAHRADCVQEGRVALVHAIDRVDTEGEFAAYAACWIRRAVRNHLVRQRLPVHAPVNLVVRATAARSQEDAGTAQGGADAARLQAVLLEMLRHPAVSLDREPAEGETGVAETLADSACECPAHYADRADLCGLVARGLEALTDKQREVLVQRYGLGGGAPRTLAEIARQAGISHQQVSMRERRALQRLESTLASAVAEYDGER